MEQVYRIAAKVSGIILSIFITLFIVLGIALVLPRVFGLKPFIVVSGSMEPVIPTGSIVYINTRDTAVTAGDIVAFYETEDIVVTHRIVGYEEDGFTTKGDANDSEDQNTVYQDAIIGTYVFNIPGAGYLVSSMSSKTIIFAGQEIPAFIPYVIVIMLGLCIINLSLESLVGDDKQISEERRRIG